MPNELGSQAAEGSAESCAALSMKKGRKMKLNTLQRSLLELTDRLGRVNYYDAAKIGARGPTLNTLTKAGLLMKNNMGGTNSWALTTAGKAALGEEGRPP